MGRELLWSPRIFRWRAEFVVRDRKSCTRVKEKKKTFRGEEMKNENNEIKKNYKLQLQLPKKKQTIFYFSYKIL